MYRPVSCVAGSRSISTLHLASLDLISVSISNDQEFHHLSPNVLISSRSDHFRLEYLFQLIKIILNPILKGSTGCSHDVPDVVNWGPFGQSMVPPEEPQCIPDEDFCFAPVEIKTVSFVIQLRLNLNFCTKLIKCTGNLLGNSTSKWLIKRPHKECE